MSAFRYFFSGLCVLYLCACSVLAMADDWSLDTLMQGLAMRKTGEATFVETKYLALLDRPVEASGTLFFQAPDQLEKRTLQPRRESLLLIGDVLTIERNGRVQTLALANYPEVAVFVEGLRATLMGNRRALENAYQIELSGTRTQWLLQLTPRQASVRKAVAHIVISGRAIDVERVEIQQADGDRSVMTIAESASTRHGD